MVGLKGPWTGLDCLGNGCIRRKGFALCQQLRVDFQTNHYFVFRPDSFVHSGNAELYVRVTARLIYQLGQLTKIKNIWGNEQHF